MFHHSLYTYSIDNFLELYLNISFIFTFLFAFFPFMLVFLDATTKYYKLNGLK